LGTQQLQSIGDRLTTALISGRFDLYRALMQLPLRVVPKDGTAYVLETEPALEDDFNQYHAVLKAHGVTDIFRQFRSSEPEGPDGMVLVATTHIMANAQRIVDPFETRFHVLAYRDDWLIREIESSEGHIKWTLGRAEILPEGQFDDASQQDEGIDDAKT
jgi:hypothetical protein